ncbi:MAG: non-canonical purine NTP pyrophosphatase, RdgB/HAM1 family [Deltaproteobacteria bacterium RBG_19FT_COMBO_56_10]|nr:MAG: non-canonical purine NTP pyrophosphatase, RdgB/HAM1 family [Deltaproteobacteria bacterium RBG_19FT_COMBO_56_10]
MKVVLATKNAGKAKEIGRMLEGSGVEIISLEGFPEVELPPETGKTMKENALLKARAAAGATGLPALADDSGLEVDFLGGAPGVYSARYSGEKATDEENWKKLLRELEGVPAEKRAARFRCAIALVGFDAEEHLFEGVFEGLIAEAPRGTGGFGYDPVFFVPEAGRTAAELAPDEKNRISHRARALDALKAFLSTRK